MQNPSKDLTFIVYNAPKAPRYIKVKKSILKSLFILIPLMVIMSIALSQFYAFVFKMENNSLKSNIPVEIQKLKKEKAKISKELAFLQKNNKELINKISKGSSSGSTISSMNLLITPIGVKDLRSQSIVSIENLKTSSTKNEVKIDFLLMNQSSKKVRGFISIMQIQDNLIQFYPKVSLKADKDYRIEYTQGESFGISNSRETTAIFKRFSNSSITYKIFIFSNAGDLLAYKTLSENLTNE